MAVAPSAQGITLIAKTITAIMKAKIFISCKYNILYLNNEPCQKVVKFKEAGIFKISKKHDRESDLLGLSTGNYPRYYFFLKLQNKKF